MPPPPRRPIDTPVTIPLLDRLIDQEPKNSQEAPASRSQTVRMLKEGLRRDLEWLLNSRRIAVPPDPALTELNRSLYMFGLPDLTSYSVANVRDRSSLLRIVQQTVAIFEPRLANVRVIPVEDPELGSRTMRFRIEAWLKMDPAPEVIYFDTVLQLMSGEVKIKGEADAG